MYSLRGRSRDETQHSVNKMQAKTSICSVNGNAHFSGSDGDVGEVFKHTF